MQQLDLYRMAFPRIMKQDFTRRLTKGELDLEIRLAWEVFLVT